MTQPMASDFVERRTKWIEESVRQGGDRIDIPEEFKSSLFDVFMNAIITAVSSENREGYLQLATKILKSVQEFPEDKEGKQNLIQTCLLGSNRDNQPGIKKARSQLVMQILERCQFDREDLVSLIGWGIEAGDVDSQLMFRVVDSVTSRDPAASAEIMNTPSEENGLTLLMELAEKGIRMSEDEQENYFRLIMGHGGTVDARGSSEHPYTPLMVAAYYGNATLVRLLLDAGANISERIDSPVAGSRMVNVTALEIANDAFVRTKKELEDLREQSAGQPRSDREGFLEGEMQRFEECIKILKNPPEHDPGRDTPEPSRCTIV